ncbi:PF14300 domain protein [Leptospira weilii serovar Ranarum str. ICFT]|uniref:PF14300 domain protein n=1 Tax=Leptospira weilii serovar Ranarum str. ICFT TaxID=1218598 RepID=N1WI35_9LEPT|nr:DUF4375 domain-containing protein [Leptospira weilii]EMY76967.1 PF14300 domain protein [Leptospira weilii serovar Ranarum str. ICFT]
MNILKSILSMIRDYFLTPEYTLESKRIIIDDSVIDSGEVYRIMEPVFWYIDKINTVQFEKDVTFFSKEQIFIYSIWIYHTATCVYGHYFFFSSPLGVVWKYALEGFNKLGLTKYEKILEMAISYFKPYPASEISERTAQLDKIKIDFDDLDSALYYDNNDFEIDDAIFQFIHTHRKSFHFDGYVIVPKDFQFSFKN